jgi:hypothetical protein
MELNEPTVDQKLQHTELLLSAHRFLLTCTNKIYFLKTFGLHNRPTVFGTTELVYTMHLTIVHLYFTNKSTLI